MINLRKIPKRCIRKERNDDLTLVTGLPTGKRRAGKTWKTVHQENDILKVHFLRGQEQARRMNMLRSALSARIPDRSATFIGDKSPYFSNANCENIVTSTTSLSRQQNQNQPTSTVTLAGGMENYRSEPTSSRAPAFVKASQSRLGQYEQRQPLQAMVDNREKSEAEYWTSFKNTTGKGSNGTGTRATRGYNNIRANSSSSARPTWNAVSSFPMTRDDASIVQQEVASMTESSSSSSSVSSFPGCQSILSHQVVAENSIPLRKAFMPSLLNQIRPPTELQTSNNGNNRCPDYGCVIQGNWVSRQSGEYPLPTTTKKYSIQQIMDILCGDAIPPTSEMSGRMFDPEQSASNLSDFQRNYDTQNQQTNNENFNYFANSNNIGFEEEETSSYFWEQQQDDASNPTRCFAFPMDSSNNIAMNDISFSMISEDATCDPSYPLSLTDEANRQLDSMFPTENAFEDLTNYNTILDIDRSIDLNPHPLGVQSNVQSVFEMNIGETIGLVYGNNNITRPLDDNDKPL